MDWQRVSKTISHALRHAPEQYGLTLDEAGRTDIDALVAALQDQRAEWKGIQPQDLEAMNAGASKQRFEIRDGKIRAFYGHSVAERVQKTAAKPPAHLYHGTEPSAASLIRTEGLKAMSRQYVHLSATVEMAREVGRRRAARPTILLVRAAEAHAAGSLSMQRRTASGLPTPFRRSTLKPCKGNSPTEKAMDREQLKSRLKGAFTAAVTPMQPNGDVDHAGLGANLRWMNEMGLAGYLLLGSTGEQVHLSEFERALVLEVGRREIPTSMVLIAGTGLIGTRTTIEETRRAALAGADVALVVTPNYFQKGMTGPALTEHYRAVADASPIPIMLYSVPGTTNVTIPAEVVSALASHPNVVGIKNSGSDAQVAAAYREAAGAEEFIILSGSPHAAAGQLLTGIADGAILASAAVAPEASVALVRAGQAGDVAATRQYDAIVRRAADRVGRFGVAGWKAGVEARGYFGGPARSPLRNLSPQEREQVRAEVAALVGEPIA